MREFRFAVRHTVPVFFTYLFIGIAFGILMSDAGFSLLLTIASSVCIYAGSMQLAMVPLLVSGAPLPLLALTAFFINARHIFYGIGFVERFRKMGWRYPYMILTLTDETYSILSSMRCSPGLDGDRASFFIAMLDHLYWICGSLTGFCAGRFLQFDMRGIGFSATAFFLVIVVDQWRRHSSKLPFLAAIACAAGFLALLGRDGFLIPSLLSCLVLLLMTRERIEKKEGCRDE